MNRSVSLRALVLAPVCLSFTVGCSASVAGEIDGEAVATLYSALFTEDEDDIGEETLTSVGAGGISVLDGCNQMAKRQENANELQDQLNGDLKSAQEDADEDAAIDALDAFAAGIVEYDEKNVPTDYWFVSVGASSIDEDEIEGGNIKIEFGEAPDEDAKVFGGVTVCRVNDHPSVGEDDNDFPIVETDQTCFSAIDADIEIVKWVPGETFEATATATMYDVDDFDPINDDEPNDVGEVEIKVGAGFCKPLQDALDDAEQIAEDAAE